MKMKWTKDTRKYKGVRKEKRSLSSKRKNMRGAMSHDEYMIHGKRPVKSDIYKYVYRGFKYRNESQDCWVELLS